LKFTIYELFGIKKGDTLESDSKMLPLVYQGIAESNQMWADLERIADFCEEYGELVA
jgi:hypothetical protein